MSSLPQCSVPHSVPPVPLVSSPVTPKSTSPSPPLRLNAFVPLTYALLVQLLDIIRLMYPSPTDKPLRLAISAAYSLGFAISARPQEYLALRRSVDMKYKINSDLSVFLFNGTPFSVCRPDLFPPSRPDFFATLVEYQKQDQRGNGGPKAIAHCDKVDPAHYCLSILFEFLQLYPPAPNSPLLSGLGSQVPIELLQPPLHTLAKKFGFDPSKLHMHSSVRSGALTALATEPDSVQQQQGGWKSLNGMLSYSHSSLSHASHVADLIHDASLVPVSVTQFTHNTFSPSPTAASSQPRLPAPITTPAPPTTGQPSC